MLLGDFSSRTGLSDEIIEYNVHLDEALPDHCALTPRNSNDTNVNEFGRHFA